MLYRSGVGLMEVLLPEAESLLPKPRESCACDLEGRVRILPSDSLCKTYEHGLHLTRAQQTGLVENGSCGGLPDSSVGKESTCNAGDPGSIPESGRSTGEGIGYPLQHSWASVVAQLIKNSPAMQETPVRFLGWEDPLANR